MHFISLLVSFFTAVALFELVRATLSDSLAPVISPMAAGLISWSSMIFVLSLSPIERRFTVRQRFSWLICAQGCAGMALHYGIPLWRLPSSHSNLFLVLVLSIPMITLTMVTGRALFSRAEIDAAFKRDPKSEKVDQAPGVPLA